MPSSNKGKGKARAAPQPTERSPLLGSTGDAASIRSADSGASSSSSALYTVDTPATGHAHRRTRRFAVLIAIFSVLLGVSVFVVLFAASFIPREVEKEHMDEAFVYSDPKLDIINVSDGGVHINLTLRGAVDVDRALAVDGRRGEGWWESLRRGTVHGLLGALPAQAVAITVPQVLVYSIGPKRIGLLNVTIPAPVLVPLSNGELFPIAIEAIGNPIAPAGDLWSWGQETWAKGTIDVEVVADEAQATIPNAWWSKWAVLNQRNIEIPLNIPVPAVPNLPPPGSPLDLSKLVTLHNYTFSSDHGLKISARASLPNPSLRDVPFALPFAIQIGPDHETIAEVVARAAKVTTSTIGLAIDGDIIEIESGNALDTFLQNYLRGDDNPIRVRGLSSMPPDYSGPGTPPPWVLRSLPSLQLDLVFPSPDERPDIIREVTIEGIKLGQGNGRMMANGTVIAHIELPNGMERVALNVSAIKPDILVHDGVVQGDDEYDPDHPPPRAFGRIAPDYYLNSSTSPSDKPNQLVVRAPFENLPLDILDGRDGVLSDFIGKVVFKGGATAGIAGIVDVGADIGVGGTLSINALPVKGEFWVGRNLGAQMRSAIDL